MQRDCVFKGNCRKVKNNTIEHLMMFLFHLAMRWYIYFSLTMYIRFASIC